MIIISENSQARFRQYFYIVPLGHILRKGGKWAERARIKSAFLPLPYARQCLYLNKNVSTVGETDPAVIKDNLIAQLTAPVKWTQSVEHMVADGAVEFVELGPGNVLQGLVKKIAPQVSATGKQQLVSCI